MMPRLQPRSTSPRWGLLEYRSGACAVIVASALLLTGCTQQIQGTAVTTADSGRAATGDGGECAEVSAPLADIPTKGTREPQLRIPIPSGWERNDLMDSQVIRYAIVAKGLASGRFAPNAVVTLESVRGIQPAEIVFEENRSNLVQLMGASNLDTESNTTCGFPSETTDYIAPAMGPAPERPIIMHAVVASNGTTTYLATLTIQAATDDNPEYQDDAQEIVDGFQVRLR